MTPSPASLRAVLRRAATTAAMLLIAASGVSRAQEPHMTNPPTAIKGLKPYEVVDRILSHKHDLLLTTQQEASLTELRDKVKEGRPLQKPTGRSKGPYYQSVKIDTPEAAFTEAFGYLDGKQQHACLMLFDKEQTASAKKS